MNPILDALRTLGGAASNESLDAKVMEAMRLSPTVLAIPHKPDRPEYSEVAYRIGWARTYLKYAGLVTNGLRGSWTLTEQGAVTTNVDAYALASRYARSRNRTADDVDGPDSDSEHPDSAMREPEALTPLAPALRADITSRFDGLLSRDAVLRKDQAYACYRRFRERFGPEVLRSLEGERLLTHMHGRHSRDSLVYWLEFKDDEDFPARFGSISGGSALKFGMYQSKQGEFWTGTGQKQVPLTLAQAIEYASRQRDELIRGA
ncbi:MAG TPA: winged helix-turn-helix domain-containing protein, partial [Polyangiaceae bacterium]|nr:winged helix-turn-helix domain-containing protein [Polyangiaceae bacterium]